MVCRAHDELRSVRDLAEFPDDELAAEDRVIEQNIVLFKFLGRIFAVVIGVIPDENVGAFTTFLIKQVVPYSLGKTVFGSGIFVYFLFLSIKSSVFKVLCVA